VTNTPTSLIDPTGAQQEGQGGCFGNEDCSEPRTTLTGNGITSTSGEGAKPLQIEVSLTPRITDTNPASTDFVRSGGSLSNDIGNARQGETLFREVLDQGGNAKFTEVEKTIRLQGTGTTTRVDIYNPEKGILESKAGYVSGSSPTSRYVIQSQNLALAGRQLGVPVRYYFYGGVSEPFKNTLRDLGITWWEP